MCNVMVICPWGHSRLVHLRDKGSWNLADAGTPQPLSRFTPNPIRWNRLCLLTCNILVIYPSGPHGCNNRSWNLVQKVGDPPVIGLLNIHIMSFSRDGWNQIRTSHVSVVVCHACCFFMVCQFIYKGPRRQQITSKRANTEHNSWYASLDYDMEWILSIQDALCPNS